MHSAYQHKAQGAPSSGLKPGLRAALKQWARTPQVSSMTAPPGERAAFASLPLRTRFTPPLCFRLHSRQRRRGAHEGAATTSAEAKQLMRGQAQIVLIHQLLSKRFCSEVWPRHWYCELYARADLKISVATLQRVTKATARMLEHHEYC